MRPVNVVKGAAAAWLLLAGIAAADAVDDAYEYLNQRHIPFTETMFHELLDRADHENIAMFLKAGMDPNMQRHGMPILVDAARKGRAKVVDALLEGGALPNVRDSRDWAALHFAALFDYVDIARSLVAKGADIKAETPLGMTPLHFAVQERDPEMVALFLDKGALPEAPSKAGITPLRHAIETDQPEILKLFEKKGLGKRIKTLRKQYADDLVRETKAEAQREKERKLKLKKALEAAGGSRSAPAAPAR